MGRVGICCKPETSMQASGWLGSGLGNHAMGNEREWLCAEGGVEQQGSPYRGLHPSLKETLELEWRFSLVLLGAKLPDLHTPIFTYLWRRTAQGGGMILHKVVHFIWGPFPERNFSENHQLPPPTPSPAAGEWVPRTLRKDWTTPHSVHSRTTVKMWTWNLTCGCCLQAFSFGFPRLSRLSQSLHSLYFGFQYF